MEDVVEIDGSYGEGGGQVLRTSLALSLLTGRPVRINRIRAGRPKPGLAAQHLRAVEASRAVCGGHVEGAALGSTEIALAPGEVAPGRYELEIGTAGATALVLHTLYLPLALAGGPSELVIRGGTHVAWSPTFHYLRDHWRPALALMGLDVEIEIRRAGYYPKGGGEIFARVFDRDKVKPLKLPLEPAPDVAKVTVVTTRLPDHVAQRQADTARELLEKEGLETGVEIEGYDGIQPGTATHVRIARGLLGGMFTSLGERGLRAEKVASRCAEQAVAFAHSDAAVDKYLADQLILPLALAEGSSEYTTNEITGHLVTNADIVSEFLPVDIDVVGEKGAPGRVTITPADKPA